MQTLNPTQPLSCPGALSDLILQAARQALPARVDSLIELPDCGERNRPLMPLLVGLIDAAKATASAVNDNAWDSGPALPTGLADSLLAELEIVRQQIRSAEDAF
jgi:hypothetical protein